MKLEVTIDGFASGLRTTSKVPNNNKHLVECSGAVGDNGVLTSLEEITRIATNTITDGFPYPQIFVFTNVIIVCSSTKIYELVNGALVEKLMVTAGYTWRAVDFAEFVYMSNGIVAVSRTSNGYTITNDLPVARAICNLNGQIIVGGL